MMECELEIAYKQLEHVRAEIERIESNGEESEFESNGARRRSRRAEISRLYQRESELLMRIQRLSGLGTSYMIATDR